MIWLAGVLLSALSFLLGRVFAQSEAILTEKRRVYEAFLQGCPVPNETYDDWTPEIEQERAHQIQKVYAPLLLYASPNVVQAVGIYLDEFEKADQVLDSNSPPLMDEYKSVAKAHNDVALEMRRDALGWSVFSHRGKSRMPALEVPKE